MTNSSGKEKPVAPRKAQRVPGQILRRYVGDELENAGRSGDSGLRRADFRDLIRRSGFGQFGYGNRFGFKPPIVLEFFPNVFPDRLLVLCGDPDESIAATKPKDFHTSLAKEVVTAPSIA